MFCLGGKKQDKARIVSKSGDINIASISIANRGTKYFSDICTTLIDIQWRWNLLLFFGGFTFTWVLFAAFYYMLCYVHGDMYEHPEGWMPCVEDINNYASAFLFSIETMTTIGYGSRYVTEACPGAYICVIAQSILGAALQFALAGLVVAKIKRAKKRRTTILFSKVACIYAEDLELRLAIRIGDMRKSDIIGAHASAYFIRKSFSKTGDTIPVQYYTMDFQSEGGDSRLFLPWPSYIIHKINEDSPLYNLSRDDAMDENFEMILVLEAVSSTLSASFRVSKSYHPWEIRWGHRFLPLGHTIEDMFDGNIVDYENFHETKPVTTPLISAKDIDELSLKGDVSPEKLQRRRDSRHEISLFMSRSRRKSVTDTFLGAESDINSVSELSAVSDTSSIDPLRRLSSMTYHGPGTMDRRKSMGNLFLSPQSAKTRRHSTGEFLGHGTRQPKSPLRRISRDSSPYGSVAFNLSRDRLHQQKILDIKSESNEDSGPRYIKKKRVTLNTTPITEPLRKISDPGTRGTPLVSMLQKRRRHSTWQFSEQDTFIKDYKTLNPGRFVGSKLEALESEESDQHDSNHGEDVQDPSKLDEPSQDIGKAPLSRDDLTETTDEQGNVSEEATFGKKVVYGSFRKRYVIERVPEIIVTSVDENCNETETKEQSDKESLKDVNSDDSEKSSADESESDATVEEEMQSTEEEEEETQSPEASVEAAAGSDAADSDSSKDNQAFMYDSEDDIGYSCNIVPSDEECSDSDFYQVNLGYESDE